MFVSGPKILSFSSSDRASTAFSKVAKPPLKASVRPPRPANFAAKAVPSIPPDFKFPLFLAPLAFPSGIE